MARPRKSKHFLPPRVYQKHGAYYFVTPQNKWVRLASVGDEQVMRVKWASLEAPVEQAGTVSALLDEYLSEYAAKHKMPRTFEDNIKESEYLKSFFGHMLPSQVEPRHVGSYLDANLEKRAVRANREKALLSHVFTWAMRHPVWGVTVKSNPCKGVARNKETKRIRLVSDEHYLGVYQYAHPNLKRLMTLIYRTLQRPSDLLKLTIQDLQTEVINGESVEVIKMKQSKTAQKVSIIISPEIKQALLHHSEESIYQKNPKLTFFQSRHRQPYTIDGMNALFANARKRYFDAFEKENGYKPNSFGLYDIKGKGATDMYQNGVPLEEIQALAGHESVRTTEIYIKEKLNKPVGSNTRKIGS